MRLLYLLIVGMICTPAMSQIGINTETPSQLLHIDSASNNTSSLSTKNDDDIVIDTNANVGLGTINPTAKLDVRGGVTIDDGTQVPGFLWTATDNAGHASWQVKTSNRTAIWRIKNTSYTFSTAGPKMTGNVSIDTGDQIGLQLGANSVIVPKGRYLIFFYGDISASEFGNLYLKKADGTTLYSLFYTEWLAGPSCVIDFSVATELYLSYEHYPSGVSIYNGYNQNSYTGSYFMVLTFLRLK